MLKDLSNYLTSLRAELQEMYEEIDNEIRNTENQNLIDDGYHNVTSKLESALNEMDTLIGDLNNGVYSKDLDLDIDDNMFDDE